MSTALLKSLPAGLVAGTWDIDASHSVAGFNVRHMMVSKVRGHFSEFSGSVTIDEDFTKSTAQGTIQTASINTNNADRDAHLRTNDFFNAEEFPTIEYTATGVEARGADFVVVGEITIRGITKPIELDLEVTGAGPDAWGNTRAGLSLTGSFNRKDFNVSWNNTLDNGGLAVSEKVGVELDLSLVLQK